MEGRWSRRTLDMDSCYGRSFEILASNQGEERPKVTSVRLLSTEWDRDGLHLLGHSTGVVLRYGQILYSKFTYHWSRDLSQ